MFCSSVCFYIFNMILYLLFYFDFSLLLGFWRTLRLVFFYLERFSTVHFIIHFPFPNFILILSEMILENFARFQMNAKNQRSSVILQYLYGSGVTGLWGQELFPFPQLNDTVFLKCQNCRCICDFELYHYSFWFYIIFLKFPALLICKNFWDFKRNDESFHITKVNKYVGVIPNNAIVDTFAGQEIYYFSKWACFIT